MKTRILKFMIAVSMFLILGGITVNAQSIKVRGDIPFDFVVGDVAMRAGIYDVAQFNLPTVVYAVRSEDGSDTVMRLVQPVMGRETPKETVLIFNRYQEIGGEYSTFLSQVWIEGRDMGFQFLKHRVEREAADRAARRDIITLVVKLVNAPAQ